MKKYILAICILLLVCTATVVTALSFSFTPIAPHVVSPRLDAIGGVHAAFMTGYDTLFSNPAGLARVKKGSYSSGFSINGSGLAADIPNIIKVIENLNDPNALTDLILNGKKLNAGAELSGPIAFGSIKNGIGFGVFNRIYALADIISISSSDITAGFELSLFGGYGFNIINTKSHVFSAGFIFKGFAQLQGVYTDSVATLISGDISNMVPILFTTGFGVDVGLLYTFADLLSIGITCQDAYTPTFSTKFDGINNFISWNSGNNDLLVKNIEPNLSAGLGVNIPVSYTNGVISSWNVYIDYRNILEVIKPVYRNPVLNFSVGTEIILLDVISLRAGIRDMYPALGAGIKLGAFNIDLSIYGRELGMEPGTESQLNLGVALIFKY